MHEFNDEDILKLERNTFRPGFIGVYIYYGSEPLRGTHYMALLDDKENYELRDNVSQIHFPDLGPSTLKKIAEECHWTLLEHLLKVKPNLYHSIKNCYREALADGIYEAANNLGVLAYNFEQKQEEGKEFLQLAIEHGSLNAMINMFTILWVEDAKAGIEFLQKNMESPLPSLRCMYNLAYLYYTGDKEKGNILTKDNERAISILNKIVECEGNPIYAVEKEAIEKASKFIKYLRTAKF